jgi:fatty-acid desaturase
MVADARMFADAVWPSVPFRILAGASKSLMSDDIIRADVTDVVSSLPRDAAARVRIVDWLSVVWAVGGHLLVFLVFVPWFFSWTGVVLLVIGIHVFGMIGINLGYHRLLTHRSFSCPRWLEHILAILGVCSAHMPPAHWVAVHRRHHLFADKEQDPHSPALNFFWGHIGWIALKSEDMLRGPLTQRYAQDLLREPFYSWLETYWQGVVLLSWIIFLMSGLIGGLLVGMNAQEATQFALSVFIWGVVARTVYVWHVSCFVNSVSHRWGYRSYETADDSRNNLFVGYFAHGEGWHNNHHADPRAALHGHRAWEFDPVFWIIRLLARLGLAYDIAMPRSR